MAAHRVIVNVLEDHRLEIRLPDEFPVGPAEVTVLAEAPRAETLSHSASAMLAVLEELKHQSLTPEEERILDDFERFRQEHPFELASLETPAE
jgi:hypothetical protein